MPALRLLAVLLFLLQAAACTSVRIVPHTPRDVNSFPERPAEPPAATPRNEPGHTPLYVPLPQAPIRSVPIPSPSITEQAPAGPQRPVPVVTCDANGCWSDGRRYEGGTGRTYLDRNGRLCQGNGSWIQCF